ncbi:ABC transporter substrate-binding protein [Knoellia subterranea]|uniref:ABC transporter substrate-binding protein n=1 Tax=Knoellia subterranea KCTC 19937 TaxID=1385521 RepID=A0A0A0JPF8_9MICO|nr:ABC transporter substrate-binding protein [Knoellia subterranea]KGN37937.1 ABC transporter substrate-binding protein [Knoellia subterranea KCTC 19937]
MFRTNHRGRGFSTAVSGLLITLLACVTTLFAGSGASADTKDEKTLTIAVSQEVDSLSPFLAVRRITTAIGRLSYDFLTNYDPKTGKTIPALAESWSTSEDGLTWTYKIRDTKWTDGQPITAEDARWTFDTMMKDEAAATANGNFVENFETVSAPDPRTLVVKLKAPQATMLALDVPILPKHKWEKVTDFAKFNNDQEFPIVGSGPWIVSAYDVNNSITLTPNKDFWRGAPKFDKLVFRYIDDSDAQVEALKAGEVDFVSGLTPAQATALESADNITVNKAKGKRFQAITLNPGAKLQDGTAFGDGNKALQDPIVREALVRTIDREAIYKTAYGGFGEANGGYIPSRYADYHWQPEGDAVIGFDIAKANSLLDGAGYAKGSDGIRAKGALKLSFRFNVHGDNPQYIQAAEMMREWAKEAGIELKVEPVSEVGALLDAGTYDILTTGWSVNPDPDYILGINRCSGLPAKVGGPYLSDAYYCNPEYDKLYAAQLAELDPAKRAGIVKQMEEILYKDNVFVVWGYADQLEAFRSDTIGSMQPQPDPGGNYDSQDGYWSWWSATPAGEDSGAASGDDGGSNSGLLVGGGAVVLAALAAGLVLMRRRGGATADDRE